MTTLDHKYRAYCENRAAREDRERARALFIAAGRPVPAWCDDAAPVPNPSVCIESDDELLDRGRR